MHYYIYKCNHADGGPAGWRGNWEAGFLLVKDWGGRYSTNSHDFWYGWRQHCQLDPVSELKLLHGR